jgi:3,4-dihydroxy 2-butanone 4-phosphate synthase/GTP cyclohydrolase II
MNDMNIAGTQEIINEIRAGRMVILVDAEDRENEGDPVMAADFVTPEAINFMARHARGLICLTLEEQRCRQLNLPLMVADNRTPLGTAFTMSIEAATGVTTGISAADRARTVQLAVAANARPDDIVQPGHIFPVMARPGGVLVRAGHRGRLRPRQIWRAPAAVICEIIKDDGEMARLPDLLEFAKQHGLKVGTIADLIRYRSITETLVEQVSVKISRHRPVPPARVSRQDRQRGASGTDPRRDRSAVPVLTRGMNRSPHSTCSSSMKASTPLGGGSDSIIATEGAGDRPAAAP